jgi:trichothecene 3-O-acetyltransferase
MDIKIKAPTLLAAEQVGPKGWIRDVICLELAADYDAESMSSLLKTAWASFKERTPLVGVEAVPTSDVNATQAGLLELRPYADGEVEDFVVKDLRGDASIPSFAELKAQNFPNSAMDNEKLCYRGRGGEWPVPGIRLTTNMMQANLIKGGLLLNHLCFHSFNDGTSMWKLMQLFAEDVRRAQGLPIEKPAEIPTADRAKLERSSGQHVCANFGQDHPEWIHLPFTPDALPDGLTKALHHAHVFRFSPEAIKALKEECSPANVRVLKGQPVPEFVSTNDVLTALLWRCVQRAEHPDASLFDDAKPSVVQVALDARRRAHIPIHPHTMGNIVGYSASILPLKKVLTEDASLADLACLIRMSVAKCGKTYHDEVAHYVENMEDVRRFAGTAFLDMPGPNVLQSNWSEFDYYNIEWGAAFGDRIKAVRFPAGGVCAGFQIIMPPPPGAPAGTVEVLADVSDAAWERLLTDELWNKYAHNPTTIKYE